MANDPMRIAAVKQAIQTLPITPRVLANLRETTRLFSTYYSTMIEGNRLKQEQVAQMIGEDQHFPGRDLDQDEVKSYYAALDEAERLGQKSERGSEAAGQRLHALSSWEAAGHQEGHALLFRKSREIAARDVAELFGYQPRTAALLCQRWVENGFLETTNPAKKSRRYKPGDRYASVVDEIA
jgi:hypothetical protein